MLGLLIKSKRNRGLTIYMPGNSQKSGIKKKVTGVMQWYFMGYDRVCHWNTSNAKMNLNGGWLCVYIYTRHITCIYIYIYTYSYHIHVYPKEYAYILYILYIYIYTHTSYTYIRTYIHAITLHYIALHRTTLHYTNYIPYHSIA